MLLLGLLGERRRPVAQRVFDARGEGGQGGGDCQPGKEHRPSRHHSRCPSRPSGPHWDRRVSRARSAGAGEVRSAGVDVSVVQTIAAYYNTGYGIGKCCFEEDGGLASRPRGRSVLGNDRSGDQVRPHQKGGQSQTEVEPPDPGEGEPGPFDGRIGGAVEVAPACHARPDSVEAILPSTGRQDASGFGQSGFR